MLVLAGILLVVAIAFGLAGWRQYNSYCALDAVQLRQVALLSQLETELAQTTETRIRDVYLQSISASRASINAVRPFLNQSRSKAVALVAVVPLSMIAGWLLLRAANGQAERIRTYEKGCGSCGYDLTGNNSGICPECGTLIRRGPTTQ